MGYVMAQYYANETVLYIGDWRKILKSNLDFNEHDNSNSTSETVNVIVSLDMICNIVCSIIIWLGSSRADVIIWLGSSRADVRSC